MEFLLKINSNLGKQHVFEYQMISIFHEQMDFFSEQCLKFKDNKHTNYLLTLAANYNILLEYSPQLFTKYTKLEGVKEGMNSLNGKVIELLGYNINLQPELNSQTILKLYQDQLHKIISKKNLKENSSVIHKLVNNYLKSSSVEYINECVIGNLVVDIFLPKLKMIIEIEGPTHFVYPTNELSLNTLSRNRILESMGYEIVNIYTTDGIVKGLDDLSNKLEKYINNLKEISN